MYGLVWFVLNFWGASGDDVTAQVGVYTHRLQIENKDESTPPIRIKGSASLIRAYNEVFQEYAAFKDNVSEDVSSVFEAIEAAYPNGKKTPSTKSMAGSRYLKQLLNVNLADEPLNNSHVYMLRLQLAALSNNVTVHLAAQGTGRLLSEAEKKRRSKTCSLATHTGIKCANREESLCNEQGALNHNACVFTPNQGLFAQAPDNTSGALYAHVRCVEQRFIYEVEKSGQTAVGMETALMKTVFGVTESALFGRNMYTHEDSGPGRLELHFEELTSQFSTAFARDSGLTSEEKRKKLLEQREFYQKLVRAVLERSSATA